MASEARALSPAVETANAAWAIYQERMHALVMTERDLSSTSQARADAAVAAHLAERSFRDAYGRIAA